jgi:hypothetical protein
MVADWKNTQFPKGIQGSWEPMNSAPADQAHHQRRCDPDRHKRQVYKWQAEFEKFSDHLVRFLAP